jgi:hypothetical protein
MMVTEGAYERRTTLTAPNTAPLAAPSAILQQSNDAGIVAVD